MSATLQAWWPQAGGQALETIVGALTEGWWPWRMLMVCCIVFGAPLSEELLFRGLLWNAMSRVWSGVGVLVASSLMFAAYHVDPHQSIPLIFSAFVLGWMRLVTGSVLPSMIAHLANNLLGVILIMVGWETGDVSWPWVLCLTVVCLSGCRWLGRAGMEGVS
jgi:hypothetical protein